MAMPRFDGGRSLTTLPSILSVPPVMSSRPAIRRSKRRLAAAGRADEDDELARLDVEVDALDDVDGAERLLDAAELKIGHYLPSPPRRPFPKKASPAASRTARPPRPAIRPPKPWPASAVDREVGRHGEAAASPRVEQQMSRSPPPSRADEGEHVAGRIEEARSSRSRSAGWARRKASSPRYCESTEPGRRPRG